MIVRVKVVLNRTVGLLEKLKLIAESPHKTPSSTLVVKGFKMIQKSKVRQTTLQHKATSFPGFSPTRSLRSERERDPGWVWSRGPRKKLIPREESFVSHFFCLVRFHRSCNDRKGKTDLLSFQL